MKRSIFYFYENTRIETYSGSTIQLSTSTADLIPPKSAPEAKPQILTVC